MVVAPRRTDPAGGETAGGWRVLGRTFLYNQLNTHTHTHAHTHTVTHRHRHTDTPKHTGKHSRRRRHGTALAQQCDSVGGCVGVCRERRRRRW